MKVYLLFAIAALFFLTSCWNKDSRLTNKIIGEWRIMEIVSEDLSKPDSKADTTSYSNNYATWEFKSDKKSYILHGTGATKKGTFRITNEILEFDIEDFEMEKMKIYEITDSYMIVGRRIEDVANIRMEFKKIKIE